MAFGGGDAFGGSYSLSINGSVVSNVRQNEYRAAIDRVWFSPETMQRRFQYAGGEPARYDSKCVSGESCLINQTHAGASSVVDAYTADSGLQKRCMNVLNCVTSRPAPANAARQDEVIVRVRWAVRGCGIFSAVSQMGDVM